MILPIQKERVVRINYVVVHNMTQVGKFSTDLGRLPVKHVSMDLGETLNTSTFMLERTQVEETRLPQ